MLKPSLSDRHWDRCTAFCRETAAKLALSTGKMQEGEDPSENAMANYYAGLISAQEMKYTEEPMRYLAMASENRSLTQEQAVMAMALVRLYQDGLKHPIGAAS